MPNPINHTDLDLHVRGYPRLAAQMAMLPTTAIFRRFGALNARNLLYMQSELTDLEKELLELEEKDSKDEEDFKHWRSRDFYWIRHPERASDKDSTQYDLVMKIREKLREYNEALYYASAIHDLSSPDPFDIHDIQYFLSSDDMALPFMGNDHATWGSRSDPESYTKDGLVTLRPRANMDTFTQTLAEKSVHVLHFSRRLVAKKSETGNFVTWGISDRQMIALTWWVSGLVAAATPVLAVYTLAKMETWEGKLATIAGSNVLVMVCLSLFTLAKRRDVFIIVALFTLIQIGSLGKGLERSV